MNTQLFYDWTPFLVTDPQPWGRPQGANWRGGVHPPSTSSSLTAFSNPTPSRAQDSSRWRNSMRTTPKRCRPKSAAASLRQAQDRLAGVRAARPVRKRRPPGDGAVEPRRRILARRLGAHRGAEPPRSGTPAALLRPATLCRQPVGRTRRPAVDLPLSPCPSPDGRTQLILSPLELIDRIAALVPPPRQHRHRYYGVLAPNSPLRPAVTALAHIPVATAPEPVAQPGVEAVADGPVATLQHSPARYT